MSNKIYNVLKWIALIGLPALSTLIFTLSNIWSFDSANIIGTISALNVFLGAVLGISTYNYNKNQKNTNDKIE